MEADSLKAVGETVIRDDMLHRVEGAETDLDGGEK